MRRKGLEITTVSDVMHQGSTLAKEAATLVREGPALAKKGTRSSAGCQESCMACRSC